MLTKTAHPLWCLRTSIPISRLLIFRCPCLGHCTVKPSLTALVVTVCIIEAPARCARLGPSMGINHILHQQPTYIASAPFKTPTDFFANNYLQHASNITFMLQKYRAQINTRSAPFEAPPFDSWITESGKRIGFPIELQTKVREGFLITEKAPSRAFWKCLLCKALLRQV